MILHYLIGFVIGFLSGIVGTMAAYWWLKLRRQKREHREYEEKQKYSRRA